jgi:hypothetical protein
MKTIKNLMVLILSMVVFMGCSKDDSDLPKTYRPHVRSGLDFIANFTATNTTDAMNPGDGTFKLYLSGNSNESSFGDFTANMCISCSNNTEGEISDCEGCFGCSENDAIFFTIVKGEIITQAGSSDSDSFDPKLWLIGQAAIKEGTGRFADATGTFDIKAFRRNPNSLNQAGEVYDFVCCGKYFSQYCGSDAINGL